MKQLILTTLTALSILPLAAQAQQPSRYFVGDKCTLSIYQNDDNYLYYVEFKDDGTKATYEIPSHQLVLPFGYHDLFFVEMTPTAEVLETMNRTNRIISFRNASDAKIFSHIDLDRKYRFTYEGTRRGTSLIESVNYEFDIATGKVKSIKAYFKETKSGYFSFSKKEVREWNASCQFP